MFWIVFSLVGLAFGLVKLGALSVWVKVLSAALVLAAVVAAALAVGWIATTIWRRAKLR